MPTATENFINAQLPLRIGTLDNPPGADYLWLSTGASRLGAWVHKSVVGGGVESLDGNTETIQLRRGNDADLPASMATGEPYYAEDTQYLYFGTGSGNEPLKIPVGSIVGLLDGGGKILTSLLPQIALTEVTVVADIPTRDALSVQEGDVAVVLDHDGNGNRKSYIYDGSEWAHLNDNNVSSVNGQTGSVTLDTDGVSEGTVNFYYTDGRVQAYLTAQNYLKSGDYIGNLGSNNGTSDDAEHTLYAADGAGNLVPATIIDGGTF